MMFPSLLLVLLVLLVYFLNFGMFRYLQGRATTAVSIAYQSSSYSPLELAMLIFSIYCKL
jgi:hypothetical protein